jgi:predicted nucleic acid-binding protein
MAEEKRRRVFVDANVLIRGSTFPRFPYEVLRLAAQHRIVLVLSPSVLDDARNYLALLFPAYLPQFEAYLATALIEMVDDPPLQAVEDNRNLVRDVEDIPIVLAAVQARVDFLVSTDRDLTDENASTERLRRMLVPGRVMKPGAFLTEVMGWSHDELERISRRTWQELLEESEAGDEV